MASSTFNSGYGRGAILLHWLVAAFMVLQFLAAWTMDVDAGAPGALANFHATLGITIAVLSLIRLVNRIANPVPQLPGMSGLQQRAAEAMHWALLFMLIVMPLMGVLSALRERVVFTLFGVIPLPQFIARDSALADFGHEAHEIGGTILLVLIGLHVAAALYHHFIVRDGVLKRMLPHLR